MEESQRKLATEQGIFSLWFNWTISTGALMLLVLLSLWISKLWLPLVALGLFGILSAWIRYGATPGQGTCRLIPWTVSRVLLASAIIMMAIDIVYVKGYVNDIFDPELINIDHPYITILILAPVAVAVGLAMMMRGGNTSICQDCRIRYGQPVERGYLGRIFNEESRYQIHFLVFISAILSVISWGYYILYYVNVNLNNPDHFFYHWIPLIIWGLSVIYLGARYFTMWGYYYGNTGHIDKVNESTTHVRFLIFSNDSIFLGINEGLPDTPDAILTDTPASVIFSHNRHVSLEQATNMFTDVSGIPVGGFRIRPMYESVDMTGTCNIFHFIVSLHDKEEISVSTLHGQWYTIPQLQRLMSEGQMSPLLTTEINRLYTITMMWKTYDREGQRLYRIKNYRPMFRITGIQDWDVDFNDSHWLYIARNNEDRPFFKLRRLWQRYVTGINRQ